MAQYRVKPIGYMGTLWYQCAMCGNWSDTIEHITMCKEWAKYAWDEVDVGQTMGIGGYSLITINNITKPFVCACCMD